jgi:uncharacterized cupin superfamily protein
MSNSIVIVPAATADLKAAPIPRDWILNGTPEARNSELARSDDRTSYVIDWNCTAGSFNWHYSEDETLVVVSGEAFITNEQGEERRLGPGDMGFFPAGSSCRWRITSHVRKFAIVRHTIPRPLVFSLRVWNRLRRMVRPAAVSPLVRGDAEVSTSYRPEFQ